MSECAPYETAESQQFWYSALPCIAICSGFQIKSHSNRMHSNRIL